MTLVLHRGAEPVDYDGLRAIDVPPATPTHVPIPHFRVVDLVKTTLGMYGHEVTAEHFGVTPDGMKFFGVLCLKSPYTGYEDMVALRNANDKAWPCSIGFGNRVFCCDNMALVADHVVKRRHTANLKRDLPGIFGELIEPLAVQREVQHRKFERYKTALLTAQQADHAIMQLYREGVYGVQRIADVAREWEAPSFAEFRDQPSAFRLFNAVTFALTGRVLDNPEATPKLHRIIQGVCETVH